MTIRISCSACHAGFTAPDSLGGKKGRCPKCGATIEVPAAASDSAEAPEAVVADDGELVACGGCGASFSSAAARCPSCGVARRRAARPEGGAFELEQRAMNKGVLGGVGLIVVAVIWFVVGYLNGFIFYYPPVLAVLGLIAIGKGLTAKPTRAPRARGARAATSRRRRSPSEARS